MAGRLSSIVEWARWLSKTAENDILTIKEPWVFLKHSGKIILTDGHFFPFDQSSKKDIVNLALFIIEHDVRFGNDEGMWRLYLANLPEITAGSQSENSFIVTPTGIKFMLAGFDRVVFSETFLYDIHYSENLYGKTVVQAGGFVGDTALYYASKGAKVYSFEPDPDSFEIATKNIRLNPNLSDKIVMGNYAFGRNGIVEFSINEEVSGDSSIYLSRGKRIVRTKSVDIQTVLEEYNIDSPYLLDLDIKGSEFEIIKDKAIQEFKKIRIEYSPCLLNDKSKNVGFLISNLEKHGFKIARIYKHNYGRYDLATHGTIEAINENLHIS